MLLLNETMELKPEDKYCRNGIYSVHIIPLKISQFFSSGT